MAAEKIAFLFPGQGSQTVGMGELLAETYQEAALTFQEADDLLGFSLSKLCWKGPEDHLNDTFNTQPALLTHSIAILRVVQSMYPDLQTAYYAGHSIGEYAALVGAGALTFQDALICVRERGRVMKEAGEESPGGMAAIIGMDTDTVEKICNQISSETEHSVWVANDNCPGQVVISGEISGLEEAEARLTSAGARKIVRLAVSIPSHCPLMSKAQEEFNQTLDKTSFIDPEIPTVGNVDAMHLDSAENIVLDLRSQLISRVRWNESMQTLISAGVTHCFELGPKSVLSGLMRRIDRSIPTSSLDSPASLSSLSDITSISG